MTTNFARKAGAALFLASIAALTCAASTPGIGLISGLAPCCPPA